MLWMQAQVPKMALQPSYKKIQNYVFDLNQILGAGNFSKVYKAVNQLNNQVVAIKVVELLSIKNKTLVELLYSEIQILQTLKHSNILNCIQVFSSNNNCYIITQYCNEGDLEGRIRDSGALSEMQARKYIYQTFCGMKYLSDQNIIHRDLKVANVFLSNGCAKIADFGFVKKLKYPNEKFKDINIGSPIYMSPEGLLKNIYGPKTDVWAFGVFIFELLHGDTPLAFCQSESQLHSNIRIPITSHKMLPNLSNELKNLIARCLDVNESTRISFQQMANHPYIIYLRNIYEKTNPVIPIQQIPLVSKLAKSQSTNISYQSKSQAETEAMINQYNNMTPLQRINSNLLISSGLPQPQVPQQQQLLQPQQHLSQIQTSVRKPNTPQTQISAISENNINTNINTTPKTFSKPSSALQPQIVESNLINTMITFPQAVQLLHYCRLAYKCLKFGKSSKSSQKLNPCLSNWVLSLLTELDKKQTTHVNFLGERATLRQEKLHQVIVEYNNKYKSELKWIPNGIVTIQTMQPLVIETLSNLDSEMKQCRNPTDLQELVKLAHYLYSFKQANQILLLSVETNNFTPMTEAKIEDFLNRKPETFTLESYGGFRNKIVSL